MSGELLGYHSEWNMGSPGGWEYQRMAQEIGKFTWQRVIKYSDIDIELDFDHPILNPVPLFAQMLFNAHQRKFGDEKPCIALIAEEETISKVREDLHFVQYLNRLPEVSAYLITPDKLRLKKDQIFLGDNKITLIFLDFNNDVILRIVGKNDHSPLLEAIKQGIVVNPRGLEPLGSKSIFEAITTDYSYLMSQTTLKKTPWTRRFFRRSTTGPDKEEIPDLVKWTRENWSEIILKPIRGHSGKRIIIGNLEQNKNRCIEQALKKGDYIVQPLIPMDLWAEEFPWIDQKKHRLILKPLQTDFRCFITNQGLIGFATRFGSIPTNVGSGGGTQATAILLSRISIREAIDKINEAILNLGLKLVTRLQEEVNKKALQMGFIYLLGPIMTTLRPRIIDSGQLTQLQLYAKNIWDDVKKLESLWQEDKLTDYIQIGKEEEEIARLAPWHGSPALIASDGLFSFRGSL
ncbi:hypothetical protein [[Eubacterium] cellulosolvens]